MQEEEEGFHSISFPSEWGRLSSHWWDGEAHWDAEGFHSISFPSEWGLYFILFYHRNKVYCFHSISFPSEWGPEEELLL